MPMPNATAPLRAAAAALRRTTPIPDPQELGPRERALATALADQFDDQPAPVGRAPGIIVGPLELLGEIARRYPHAAFLSPGELRMWDELHPRAYAGECGTPHHVARVDAATERHYRRTGAPHPEPQTGWILETGYVIPRVGARVATTLWRWTTRELEPTRRGLISTS